MSFSFKGLCKAVAFSAQPVTWLAARGIEKLTGNDNIVRNDPRTYYTDLWTSSKPAPAGGATGGYNANDYKPAVDSFKTTKGLDNGEGDMTYLKAQAAIEKLSGEME